MGNTQSLQTEYPCVAACFTPVGFRLKRGINRSEYIPTISQFWDIWEIARFPKYYLPPFKPSCGMITRSQEE
jgi:hypothetical protein